MSTSSNKKENNMEHYKMDYQLIAHCAFNAHTGKAEYENFTHYYKKKKK